MKNISDMLKVHYSVLQYYFTYMCIKTWYLFFKLHALIIELCWMLLFSKCHLTFVSIRFIFVFHKQWVFGYIIQHNWCIVHNRRQNQTVNKKLWHLFLKNIIYYHREKHSFNAWRASTLVWFLDFSLNLPMESYFCCYENAHILSNLYGSRLNTQIAKLERLLPLHADRHSTRILRVKLGSHSRSHQLNIF